MTNKNSLLEAYKISIERLAKTESDFVFNNSGADHAAIVLATIFKNSNSVRIYANDMNGDISNQPCYMNAVKDFALNSGTLKIIIDTKDKISSTLKNLIKNNEVEVKISDDKFKDALKAASKDGKNHYFAVGDDKMIRVEIDNENHKALCSFNNPKTAYVLTSIFDEYFHSLNPVVLS